MNDEYLSNASNIIQEKMVLVNLASKRARELARGSQPLVKTQRGESYLDIALLEIAQKKIIVDPSSE